MTTHLNLLPWSFRRRMLIRRRCREWAVGLAIACCIPLAWCITAIHHGEQLRAELQEADELAEPIRRCLRESQQLSAERARTGRREELVNSLRGRRSPIQLLGMLSDFSQRERGAVQVRNLNLMSDLPSREAGQVGNSHIRLGLQGIAVDDHAVSGFVGSLRTSGVFESVDLRQSSDREAGEARVREFAIECTLSFGSAAQVASNESGSDR